MIASYHNHTTWSDGRATVDETVAAAREQGLDEIGISDHLVLRPDGTRPSWSMDPARLGEYVEDVLRAAAASPSPRVRLGAEVDWFPGHGEAIAARLDAHPFDYRIGSVHEVEGFGLDGSAEAWDAMTEAGRNGMHRAFWRAIAGMARSGLFDLVGHLDLTKKFGHRPTVDLSREVDAALDAIAEADLAVELNTSGWSRPCAEAYPSDALLRACRSRGIPALVNADAHRPEHLRRDLEKGWDRLRSAGYREVVLFEGRRRTPVPLPVGDPR